MAVSKRSQNIIIGQKINISLFYKRWQYCSWAGENYLWWDLMSWHLFTKNKMQALTSPIGLVIVLSSINSSPHNIEMNLSGNSNSHSSCDMTWSTCGLLPWRMMHSCVIHVWIWSLRHSSLLQLLKSFYHMFVWVNNICLYESL